VVAQKEKFKMNKGIEILLERMDSNPEEFVINPSVGVNKWDRLLHNYVSILDKEDIEAYQTKLKQVAKDQFTKEVMKELLDPKLDLTQYIAKGTTVTTLGTWGTGAVDTSAFLDAQNYQTEQMRLHVDAQRKAAKKATPR
jgi:hypothetical protein